MPSQGIVFFASGPKYVEDALVAVRRSQRYNPIPHLVFSSPAIDERGIDCRSFVPGAHVWLDRIDCFLRSPFERTLFLDIDCHVLTPLIDMFALLDRYEIAAAHAPGYRGLDDPLVPKAFFELNCGVILCRTGSSKVKALLRSWGQLFEAWRSEPPFANAVVHDQPAFRRAIWQSDASLYVLGPEYNWRPAFPSFLRNPPLILHGYHHDPESIVGKAEASGFGAMAALMPHLTDLTHLE